MLPHLIPAELKAVADALALTNSDLAALNRFIGQSGATRATPALTIHFETDRLYKGGANAIGRVTLTIESEPTNEAGGDADEDHRARVALVQTLFIDQRADRKTEIAARGKITVDDWGQISPLMDKSSDGGADRLRSVLVLRTAARLAPPV